MIRSMTSFARCVSQGDWGNLQLELRSVNHRYLELNLRLPEPLRALEPKVRERLNKRLGRGKVDCNFHFQSAESLPDELTINEELVKKLAHASREVDALLYNPSPVNSLDVLRWPGVMQPPEMDEGQLHTEALLLLDQAIDEMQQNRGREGGKLKDIILKRCDAADEVVETVRTRMPEVMTAVRTRLQEKLQEILSEVDAERLEQEMVIAAQKLDVDEEMDRLVTHLNEVRRVLESDKPVGRRLDFLMQELNREANTLGSKSADTETTKASVELKVLIEQMREQVQNIE